MSTLKGNVKHSACQWCYGKIPSEEFFEKSKEIGLTGIDLLNEKQWPIAFKHGLECSMATGDGIDIVNGFNNPKNHEKLLKAYEHHIPKAAGDGIKQIICFSGNRAGISEDEGLEHCAKGLDTVVKLAEKHNITLVMELLNSKVNHEDYQCDHTAWGAALCEKVGSPNLKLLYDIYHMQIMEGDIIATIKKYHPYISHYHTGGVPGRNEIDESQELYYPAIMKAIVGIGFKGYVAQEFIPAAADPLASLKNAVHLCDV